MRDQYAGLPTVSLRVVSDLVRTCPPARQGLRGFSASVQSWQLALQQEWLQQDSLLFTH